MNARTRAFFAGIDPPTPEQPPRPVGRRSRRRPRHRRAASIEVRPYPASIAAAGDQLRDASSSSAANDTTGAGTSRYTADDGTNGAATSDAADDAAAPDATVDPAALAVGSGDGAAADQPAIDLHPAPLAVPRFDLAGLLRRARRNAEFSQREMASAIGVSKSTLARAEADNAAVSVPVLLAALAVGGIELMAIDRDGEVEIMRPDALRDRGGRKLPAHLEAYVPEESDRVPEHWRGSARRNAPVCWRLRNPRYPAIELSRHHPGPEDVLAARRGGELERAFRKFVQEARLQERLRSVGEPPAPPPCFCSDDCVQASAACPPSCPCQCEAPADANPDASDTYGGLVDGPGAAESEAPRSPATSTFPHPSGLAPSQGASPEDAERGWISEGARAGGTGETYGDGDQTDTTRGQTPSKKGRAAERQRGYRTERNAPTP